MTPFMTKTTEEEGVLKDFTSSISLDLIFNSALAASYSLGTTRSKAY